MNAGNVDVAMFQLWPQRIRHWLFRELKKMFAFSTERMKMLYNDNNDNDDGRVAE